MGGRSYECNLVLPDDQLHKIECRQCCIETNHKIAASYVESGSDETDSRNYYYWNQTSQIIQCVGCDLVSFRTISTNSEDYEYDEEHRYAAETIKFYPGRSTGLKGLDRRYVPYRIAMLYEETKSAIENDLSIIGGIGVRAILDAICKDVKASGKDLYKKIDDLHNKSLVTKEGVAALHKIRLLGNKSAHEAESHSREQLSLALEIVNYILVGTYVMPEKVKLTFMERPVNPFANLPPPPAPLVDGEPNSKDDDV
ncbi:DUF4145 domain-containing protein [Pseudomonas sp. NFACC42-2]|uniref:DUF4145 domain-containing protein n=1 Tax=Pseudomonas sp. NFACC42-2 TaxID=1566193 RepID=UPI0008ECF960|nr:DUF4145 domain-containing protein [Pseudomonas sp. NFACC42-2]SFS27668.1 protein of unknown function [Pseudomonas sp. NFACC42-2]